MALVPAAVSAQSDAGDHRGVVGPAPRRTHPAEATIRPSPSVTTARQSSWRAVSDAARPPSSVKSVAWTEP